MYYGRKKYVGKNKNQKENGVDTNRCEGMAVGSLLTQMFYDKFDVLLEWDIPRLWDYTTGKKTINTISELLYNKGISEEDKKNEYLTRINLGHVGLPTFNDVIDVLKRNGYVKGSYEGHAMYLLGVDVLTSGTVLYHMQDSYGKGIRIIEGRKSLVNLNNFQEYYLVEPYQRLTVTVGSNEMEYNFRKVRCNYAKPILVNGSMYVPLREVSERLGDTVLWHGDSGVPLSDGTYDWDKATIVTAPKARR